MSREKEQRRLERARDVGVLKSGRYVRLGKPDRTVPKILQRNLYEHAFAIMGTDPRFREWARAFFWSYQPVFDDLELCVSVNRLVGLPQFGIKTDVLAAQFVKGVDGVSRQVTSSPSLHARADHSRLAAAIMVCFGLKLGLSGREIATGALGALLHDIGHPAFGHDLDDILVALGRPNHEARGARIICSDPDIEESLKMAGVETEAVLAVIREEGQLGRLQNIADTLSYVVLDSQLYGEPVGPDVSFITRVIGSVEAVEDECYRVNDPEPISRLINWRADLYRDVYGVFQQRIVAHVLRNFYRTAINLGMFEVVDFERGTDAEIKARLPFVVREAKARGILPVWFDSVSNLAFGFFDGLVRWRVETCLSEPEAQAVLNRLSPDELATSVLIKPWDYRKKTYRVIDSDGHRRNLAAPKSHIPEHMKQWHVLYYPN
ncbi:MAG: HD domain-containing protein [Candidatus Uhrbacteria bacterium]|nr:HD domain-containing protein [Patescibacteria group bacterium]MBU1706024.1 HD domain-containing protein [Patescibacteria group bacterium]MBU1906898.1 HD domain-containing protein [Patescibacteria group bacterium]